MKLCMDLAQVFAVHVQVDLGGGDGFVAEHFLHGAEVGAAFDEVGGKGMAEGVGTHVFVQAGEGGEVFDGGEDADAGEAAPLLVEKGEVFVAPLDGEMDAHFCEVMPEMKQSGFADGHEALFAAFSKDFHKALIGIDAREFEAGQLGDAEAGGIEDFEQGPCADALRRFRVDSGKYGLDLLHAQHDGQLAAKAGQFQLFAGVVGEPAVGEEKSVKGAQGGDIAGQGALAEQAVLHQKGEKFAQTIEGHQAGVCHLHDRCGIELVPRDVVEIGHAGIFGDAPLQGQVELVFFQCLVPGHAARFFRKYRFFTGEANAGVAQ